MTAAGAALTALTEDYLASLRAERGLAAATITAYRRDLRQYLAHLGPRAPDAASVASFVAAQHESGLAATTVARRLAAVRGFHRFLLAEGLADDDPTRLVDSPQRGRALPKALTVEETFALVEAPDLSRPGGRRDRALLEFLYATGCRVAEAVALFCYQIRKWIGAFSAALGGLDALVFAGGIGENAACDEKTRCRPRFHRRQENRSHAFWDIPSSDGNASTS